MQESISTFISRYGVWYDMLFITIILSCSIYHQYGQEKKYMIIYSNSTVAPVEGMSAVLDIASDGTITSKGWHSFRKGLDDMQNSPAKMVYDPDAGKVVSYTYSGTGGAKCYYYVQGLRESNMTDNNYVGLSQASYTDGQTAKISVTGSVNEAVSGLVVGNKYYVIADGTLSTTADSGNITAGIPLATNKLLLR